MSAHVGDALLGIRLGRGRWLRRQLKHCCRLTLAQERQQHDPPIRKFERIVMCGRLVLVDLSKDCRPVDGLRLPPQQASRQHATSPAKANPVPGITQTASPRSSAAEKPRVPVPKSTLSEPSKRTTSRTRVIGLPSQAVPISPTSIPALAEGPSGSRPTTRTARPPP